MSKSKSKSKSRTGGQSGSSPDAAGTSVAGKVENSVSPIDVADAAGDTSPAQNQDVRGVLIQLTESRLLLPNATIAEVMSYAEPEPVNGAPEWLLGRIRWRGWQLPLVAFASMVGISDEQSGLGAKVVVLKALGGNPGAPYFAMLSQGFPRLVTVSREGLVVESEDGLPMAVQAQVRLNEDEAYVPDLQAVETLIAEALSQAA